MFEAAARDLAARGADFRDVARIWIHLEDIGRDYADLNRVRRAFFAARGVDPPPASTGIGGPPLTAVAGGSARPRISLALHAVPGGSLRSMRARTLNEAPEYGSDFARGTRVARPEGDLLHLSGTSAVDERGRSVAAGDFGAQAERTLLNVHSLLDEQGAGFPDVLLAVSYLKDRRYLPSYLERVGPLGLLDVPHAIVEADICREELLCELEAIAIHRA